MWTIYFGYKFTLEIPRQMCTSCATKKIEHAVIRPFCEFTTTWWLDSEFNHAMSGIWHSTNYSTAASPASMGETHQPSVASVSPACPLTTSQERRKNCRYDLPFQKKHDWVRLVLHILLLEGISLSDCCDTPIKLVSRQMSLWF